MPLTVNFAKAQVITKDRLRVDREPLFAEQDILYMRATESGESTTDIVAEKQRLRDITDQVDSATTLDQLKAMEV